MGSHIDEMNFYSMGLVKEGYYSCFAQFSSLIDIFIFLKKLKIYYYLESNIEIHLSHI